MPAAIHRPAGRVSAIVNGEPLAFADRIYHPEPSRENVETLGPTQQLILGCVYSRHHDGHRYFEAHSTDKLAHVLDVYAVCTTAAS
jgi:hypothetical protein